MSHTITYQISRSELIKVLFRRMSLRPQRIRLMALFAIAAILVWFAAPRAEYRYVALMLTSAVCFLPIGLYRAIAKGIDQDPRSTSSKSLTFDPAGVKVVGADYQSELSWSFFKGFSENAEYFFLHLTDSGFDSMVPKKALTEEEQTDFRRWAEAANAARESSVVAREG